MDLALHLSLSFIPWTLPASLHPREASLPGDTGIMDCQEGLDAQTGYTFRAG